MTKPRTYVAIILDKSGSMAATKASAISGFNEQVQQLKEDSKTQEIFCSLVTFNGEVFEHLWNVSAAELSEANVDDFVTTGSTAMLDAVGYTVQKLLNTTEHEDPNTAYLVITISDGDTNMDKQYNYEAIKELTEGCQNTKKWTFSYVGCTKEYLEKLSKRTGTPVANMAAWNNRTDGATELGFKNMRKRQKKYFAERMDGQMAASGYASSNLSFAADFTKEIEDIAPAPVLVNVDSIQKVEGENLLRDVLKRQPKYENQQYPNWNGGQLLANSMKVKWQKEN